MVNLKNQTQTIEGIREHQETVVEITEETLVEETHETMTAKKGKAEEDLEMENTQVKEILLVENLAQNLEEDQKINF